MRAHACFALAAAAGLLAGLHPFAGSPQEGAGFRPEIRVAGTGTQVRFLVQQGRELCCVSLDGGRSWSEPTPVRNELKLRYREFDPLFGEPPVPGSLVSPAWSRLFIVQFHTMPLEAYRAGLTELGVEVHPFLAWQAHIVRMDPALVSRVRALPYVRWVGAFHPAYRLHEELRAGLEAGALSPQPVRYNVMLVERPGDTDRLALAATVERLGGEVVTVPEGNLLITARLTPEQLIRLAAEDTVLWIDRFTEAGEDMDNARIQGGADAIETKKPEGYTGKGIRGMILEGIYATHPEFAAGLHRGVPIVLDSGTASGHGNSTFGQIFALGARPQARGLLPDGQGIYCNYRFVYNNDKRYAQTRALVDPQGPYRGMFQTASWGYAQITTYDSRSAEMDRILFDFDLPVCNSQSNTGTQRSRPQAWAKNIISGGGIAHYNTLSTADDKWTSASIGPAADGRVKPDLCAYYDGIYTTGGSATAYTSSFGGTSGATPIIAGHVGLSLELYTDGLFGHPMPGGATARFGNRPHMTTTKALLINTARQYPFPNNQNFTRFNQGWGWPSVQDMYDLRDKMHIVDEWDVLKPLQRKSYWFYVAPGEAQLRATMTYADPEGSVPSTIARINDLHLKLTSPVGTGYWGNQGLLAGTHSTPGGTPSSIDTVENVFVKDPPQGLWLVEVIAAEINQDGHVETPGLDADYALVVSGIGSGRDRSRSTLDLTTTGRGDLTVTLRNLPKAWHEGWTLLSLEGSLPAGLGSTIGLEPDALTQACAALPGAPGSFIHFTGTNAPGLFPNAPYQVPPGVLSALKGRDLDACILVFDKAGQILDVSNTSRVRL